MTYHTLYALPYAPTAEDALGVRLNDGLSAVDSLMHTVVSSDVTTLRDASHHILAAGGKRVRPRLALLSFIAVGGDDVTQVAPIAAAIELMHTASVVHDDINDHGMLRRGRPSVNAIWGRTFALLTGDFLFTKVYELMAPLGELNVDLAEAAVALVEGETLQASAVKENRLTREVYMDIIGRKTAALFRAAAAMGGKIGGATPAQAEALGQFGYNIGLAFQIIDDVLDLIGDADKLGKTAGLDTAQGKGFASVSDDTSAAPADPMEAVKRRLLEGDAIEKARTQAHLLVSMAVSLLDVVPGSPAKDGLIALANSVVEREF